MKNGWKAIIASVVASSLIAAASPGKVYAEGQVWEYRTRPGDTGSLLKIQKIETFPGLKQTGLVYHVGLIGVHFSGLPKASELRHAPFSKASLDASVTRLSHSKAAFPDPTEGIAMWRADRGGVYTITVAEALRVAEQTLAHPTN